MLRKCLFTVGLVAIGTASSANAGVEQIGDFRIHTSQIGSAKVSYDPGFGPFQSRGIDIDPDPEVFEQHPAVIFSQLTGGTQNADGGSPVDNEDIATKNFTSSTQVISASRFAPSIDGGTTGASRIGMAQWSFDLTPLDSYLATNNLALDALDMDLLITANGLDAATKKKDLYLSYTNAAESMSIASIDNSTVGDAVGDGGAGSINWTNFFNPARGSSVGDLVGNGGLTHKVLHLDHVGDIGDLGTTTPESTSLLDLYNAGVRQFNLQVAFGDFWASSRHIRMRTGSGISITTSPGGNIPGDLDGDGFVGLNDLDLILNNWNQNVPPADPLADPSGDGFVGLDDLDVVLNNWNNGTPPPANTVPEPAGIALLGLGSLAVLRRR